MTVHSRQELSSGRKTFLRISGAFALLLFLTPSVYVIKYYVFDLPREKARAQIPAPARYAFLRFRDPCDIAVQAEVAQNDPNPQRRREAALALGETASTPGAAWRHPMETLTAKATLAEVATQDANPTVRAAASDALGKIAQGGVVIRR